MLSYCLKCRKNTESKNPKVARIKNGRIILLSEGAVSDGKKVKFTKEQEASGLLSSLGIKTLLSKIPLEDSQRKNWKIKKIGDSQYIYKKKQLDKACFQHDMAYGDFKDFTRRAALDKIMHDEGFNIAKIQNRMNIKRVLL